MVGYSVAYAPRGIEGKEEEMGKCLESTSGSISLTVHTFVNFLVLRVV